VITENIEYISLSTSKLPSEIAEDVEMSSFISVFFSGDDTLASQVRNAVHNGETVEVSTLGVGEEDISGIDSESHVSVLEGPGQTNIIAQDTGHSPGIYTCPPSPLAPYLWR